MVSNVRFVYIPIMVFNGLLWLHIDLYGYTLTDVHSGAVIRNHIQSYTLYGTDLSE